MRGKRTSRDKQNLNGKTERKTCERNRKEEQNKEKLPCRSNQWLKASPRWLKVLLGKGRIAGIKGCEKLVEQHRSRVTAKAEKRAERCRWRGERKEEGERGRRGWMSEWLKRSERVKVREGENEPQELQRGFLSISASFCPISTTLPAVQTPLKPNKAWTQSLTHTRTNTHTVVMAWDGWEGGGGGWWVGGGLSTGLLKMTSKHCCLTLPRA